MITDNIMVNYIYDIDSGGVIGDYDNIDTDFINNIAAAMKLNSDSIKNTSLLTFYKLKNVGAKRMFGKTYDNITDNFIENYWIEKDEIVYFVYITISNDNIKKKNNQIINKKEFYDHFKVNQNKITTVSDEDNIRLTYHVFQTYFQVMKLNNRNPIAKKIEL